MPDDQKLVYNAGHYFTGLAQGMGQPDQEELRKNIASVCNLLQGRHLGAMYPAVSRLVINDAIELGIIRRVDYVLQGYLIRRDALNPRFPATYHFPGLQQIPGESDASSIKRGVEAKYKIPLVGKATFILRDNPTPEDQTDDGSIHSLYLGGWIPSPSGDNF